MKTETSVKAWLNNFARCVQTQDFKQGRRFFHRKVYCFGSKAAVCKSLDQLVNRQWKMIWPNIEGFCFNLKQVHYQISGDQCMACIMAPWNSMGFHKNGKTFQRRGRVTILLTRKSAENRWQATYTHYSLYPGTPEDTSRR